MKPTANPSPRTRPLRIDRIGARGFNAMHRVLPALAPYAGAPDFAGYDLAPGPEHVLGLPVEQIRDDADLARRMRQRRPDVVWIETPDDVHPAHIELALESGAPLILCEKCIAADTEAGAEVLRRCRRTAPHQQVRFIDHYLSLSLVRTLHANTTAWLGEGQEMRVVLLESQGVPPHQERSHANGMTNFFHHVRALAALWWALDDLIPVEAGWARHPAARVRIPIGKPSFAACERITQFPCVYRR